MKFTPDQVKDTKSFLSNWVRSGPGHIFRTGDNKIVTNNYLRRALQRELAKCGPENFQYRKNAYIGFHRLRDLILKTFDCDEIKRDVYGKTNIPVASFNVLDCKGESAMRILCKKHGPRDTWTAGTVTFDAHEFGQKTVRLEAAKSPSTFWRMMYWNYLIPFMDDVKSVKARLEGSVQPNTEAVCLGSHAKSLGLKTITGPSKLYLLDYNILIQFGKDGRVKTDSEKFRGKYTFGQACHILYLIAGKPDVDLSEMHEDT